MERVLVNTPPSNRGIARFKSHFPNASFMGSVTLGSKRKQYALSREEYENNLELLKRLKVTKARK